MRTLFSLRARLIGKVIVCSPPRTPGIKFLSNNSETALFTILIWSSTLEQSERFPRSIIGIVSTSTSSSGKYNSTFKNDSRIELGADLEPGR